MSVMFSHVDIGFILHVDFKGQCPNMAKHLDVQ